MLPLPRARVSFQSPIDSTTTAVVRNKTTHKLQGMKMVRPSSHVRFVDWNATKPTPPPLENSKLCRRVSLPPTTTTTSNINHAAPRNVIAHNAARRRMAAPSTFVINRVTNSVTAAPPPPPSPFHRIIQQFLPLYASCRTAAEVFDVVTLVLQHTLEQGLLAVVRNGQLVAAPLAAARRCVHRALEAEQLALLRRGGCARLVAIPVQHNDAPPKERDPDGLATKRRQGYHERNATVAVGAALVDSSESESSSSLRLLPLLRTSRADQQRQQQHTRHVSFCSALDLLSAVATANNV